MRILVVEDDKKIARFVVHGLNQAGFAVDHATDGEDGLHLALHEQYDAAVVQSGLLQFHCIELWLMCQEEATFQQGTDIRTEHHTTHRQLLFRIEDVKLDPSKPFEQRCRLSIPEDGMHSFHSPHNAVSWKLLVRGEPKAMRAFERSFPILVYPAA